MAERLSFCMVTTFYPPHNFGGDATVASFTLPALLHLSAQGNTSAPRGKAVYDAHCVDRLTNALARRGHRVTVVHSRDAHTFFNPRGPLGEFPNERGVTVRTLGESGKLGPITTYLTGKPGLYASRVRDVFAEPFDVIHFHNPSLVGGPGALSYGRGLKLFTLKYWRAVRRAAVSAAARSRSAARRSSGATQVCSSAPCATSISFCRRAASRSRHIGAAVSRDRCGSSRTSSPSPRVRRLPCRRPARGRTSSVSADS